MIRTFVSSVCIAMLLIAGRATHAATYTLSPDADTMSRANQATNNYGATTVLSTGAAGTNVAFFGSYLAWNLPVDLAGATINSASLTVPLRNVPANAAGNYSLQAYTQAWVEGTGNVSPSGDGVTYSTYDGINNWPVGNTNGGFSDRANSGAVNDNINFDTQAVAAAAYVSETTPAATVAFDAKSIVEYWAAGNLNAGLAIQVDNSTTEGLTFWSREAAASNVRPVLTIDYTPIPEPGSIGLIGLGVLLMLRRY